MRTAIFLGMLVMSASIRPDMIMPTAMGAFVVIGLVMFIIMDIIDFIHPYIKLK